MSIDAVNADFLSYLKLPDGCIFGVGRISGSGTKAHADFSGQPPGQQNPRERAEKEQKPLKRAEAYKKGSTR
jgi:hypothetical protein